MKSSALVTLAVVVSLAGCGAIRDSKVNPFNWFGKSRAETTEVALNPNERKDGRILVDQVTALRINRTPSGAVIEAVGLPPTQGFWFADLVALNDGYVVDGVLTYEFRIARPITRKSQGTPQTREVTVATAISKSKLASARQIRVVGARSSRSSSR